MYLQIILFRLRSGLNVTVPEKCDKKIKM